MERIRTATRQVDKFGPGRDGFTNGNVTLGTPSTQLEDHWFDSTQEEIARVIELEGIALDGNNFEQLWAAIQAAINRAIAALPPFLDQPTADLRYLRLTGGTIAGPLYIEGLLGLTGDATISGWVRPSNIETPPGGSARFGLAGLLNPAVSLMSVENQFGLALQLATGVANSAALHVVAGRTVVGQLISGNNASLNPLSAMVTIENPDGIALQVLNRLAAVGTSLLVRKDRTDGSLIEFRFGNNRVGGISTNGSSVAYENTVVEVISTGPAETGFLEALVIENAYHPEHPDRIYPRVIPDSLKRAAPSFLNRPFDDEGPLTLDWTAVIPSIIAYAVESRRLLDARLRVLEAKG